MATRTLLKTASQTIAQTEAIVQSIPTRGFAARTAKGPLGPFEFNRRAPGPNDIVIDIFFCGVCHSDIHQVNGDWGGSSYPMVPGHEIVGRVSKVGSAVKKFKVGDNAGVGCMVDSCRACASCKDGEEQFCESGATFTYNSPDKTRGHPHPVTYGGYSDKIVVDESFALKISPKANLAATAPLLCAGITTYSPLRHWKVGPGQRVGIVGLGGLGHMGLKFARAFGAQVTLFTTSPSKKADALRLGAHDVVISTEPGAMQKLAGTFDFILDTVSAPHDMNALLFLLKRNGHLVLVGLPAQSIPVAPFALIRNRHSLAGSLIGGISETQEMLDYCAKNNIVSDIELIPIGRINEAYERTIKSDVKYRFVIDMKSLGKG